MSERDKKPRGPYGKPAPGKAGTPRFGRPAPKAEGGPRYGRPAPAKDGSAPRYGRPAPAKEGGAPRYGRPAPAKDANAPRYGRPAPAKEGGAPRYGRPAPAKDGNAPHYGRPAPAKDGGAQRYGRPAPAGEGSAPRFGRPAPARDGAAPRFGRRPGMGAPARPGFARPAQQHARPGDRPSFRPAPSISSDARKSALEVLNRVLLEDGYAALTLDDHFQKVNLHPRDKRLTTQLVYRTLEDMNRLDYALDTLLDDPERLEKRVRNLLRLSAAQILLLDRIPDSAAVNEAVKLTRDMGLEDLTGLVNGVLRNLIRQRDEIQWPTPEDGARYYHIMYSWPLWLVDKILDAYGQEEGDRILRYRAPGHRVVIRPNLNRITREGFQELLEKKVWQVAPGLMPDAWYVSGASDLGLDADFLDGKFSIQGESSMMAAEAMQPKLGSQVLDCCAAPGGKAAYMAEKMQGTGRVQAWDVHAHRADLIQSMAERLRLYNIRPAMRDAVVFREQLESTMDGVLLDAPCTGTGVTEGKPDIRHRLKEEDLTALVALQRKLLHVCSRYVKPGGTLVYATCSLLPEENKQQVEAFLATHPEFSVEKLPESIPEGLRAHEDALGLQLLPHRDGVEGFYLVRMRRA